MEELLEPLEWHTEKRKVKDLVPYEHNPRILTEDSKERLKKSMSKFNLVEIPALNSDNVVIAGHQRLKILIALGRGDEEIDCRLPNRLLTETELKEYNVTSNIAAGIWDSDVLEEFFKEIDLESLGLDISKIEMPFSEKPAEKEREDLDVDLPKEPITVLGDLYEFHSLEKRLVHKVHCGDSRIDANWEKLCGAQKFDLVVTDPPYNVKYEGGTKDKLKIQNDDMYDGDFYSFLYDFYMSMGSFVRKGAAWYIWHADTEGANFRMAFKNAGNKLSQCLIWKKNSLVLGRQDYQWIHEPCLYGVQDEWLDDYAPCLYGWKEGAGHDWYSDRKQTTVMEFNRPQRNADHPTMKPIDLISYQIGNSSKRHDLVGDGFLGSGSTLIACEQTSRNCYGQELGENYCDVIVRRWVQYMKDNNLGYKVMKNGAEMTTEEINQYLETTD